MLAEDALQTEFQNYRQTDFLFLSDSRLYIVHLGLASFSGRRKNSENIGLLKSKQNWETSDPTKSFIDVLFYSMSQTETIL